MSADTHPFAYCPRCGAGGLEFNAINRFTCGSCGFLFYQNTATATGVILSVTDHNDDILFLRRAVDPQKGMLDFPGGFVEPGESVESALAREVQEEIGCSVGELAFLCSAPNRYTHRDVTYPTCDLVFTGRVDTRPSWFDRGEIEEIVVIPRGSIDVEAIAFPSLRAAMRTFLHSN